MSPSKKIYCADCKEPCTPTDVRCPKCDGRVVKHCHSCGCVLSVAKRYCDSCGEEQKALEDLLKHTPTPLPPAPPPAKPAGEPEPPPRKERPPKEEPPMRHHENKDLKLDKPGESKPKERSGLSDYIPKTMISGIGAGPDSLPDKRREPEVKPLRSEKDEPPRAEKPEKKPAPPAGKGPSQKDKLRRAIADREKLKASPPPPLPAKRGKPPSSVPTLGDTIMRTIRKPTKGAVFSTVLGLVLLVGGALLYFHLLKSKNTPDKQLVEAAGRYLYALKEKNYAAAYAMLSARSRKTCRLEDFQKLQDSSVWTFDDIRIASLEPGQALVRYKLLVSAKPVEDDWLYFVREDGAWKRAYWWHLAGPIEEDLAAGNAETARARAQAGVMINQRDALLRSDLCEASYRLGDYGPAERECLKALELVKNYPSRLTDHDLFYINSILADIYRNRLKRYPEALQRYKIMLAYPRLDSGQTCETQLALADTLYLSGKYGKAVPEYEAAADSCTDPEELGYLRRAVKVLSGRAGEEAVEAAKRYRMPGETKSLLEWRREARRRRMGRGHRYDEDWHPEHVSGSLYKVSVRNEDAEVLTAQVDLWTRIIEVSIHVQ